MFSIGILGFIVWSLFVGLFKRYFEVINFAFYWNKKIELNTRPQAVLNNINNLLSENFNFIFQLVGNRITIIKNIIRKNIVTNASEIVRETSFNFTEFYKHHAFIHPIWLQ